jgi:hypothetical protein
MGLFAKLKKGVGGIVAKVKDAQEQAKQDDAEQAKLLEIQQEFTSALSKCDNLYDDREMLYLGTREVDKNVNKAKSPTKKANNVYNILYEFVETVVDPAILQPAVRSKRQGFENQAKIIEDSLKSDLMESDILRINDENERTTPIQGFSIITVVWNPDFKHHLYRGELELDNRHPKCFVPQPGVFNVQKMDKYWIMSSETKEYVKRRYKIDVSDEEEQYPEINSIASDSNVSGQSAQLNSKTASTRSDSTSTDKVTIITKWYKDEDGDIGKYTWCNDIKLEDMPKYFARRDDKGNIIEYETLTADITRADGSIIPAMSPKLDEMGNPVMEPVMDMMGNPALDQMGMPMQQPVMEPTRIPYFTPRLFPVIIRRNVPVAFQFGGQSDIDVVRDQADAIKKVVTKIEQKVLDGTALVKLPTNPAVKITDEIYKVIRGDAADLAQVGIENIQADISKDIEFAREMYRMAQSTLGITDSFQGKPDATAQSGYAKRLQINQASGRMQSKAFNKNKAYKELFEIMFEFKLAFYDEIRPFLAKDQNGNDTYGEFSKYDYLMQDAAGEWFYNTDFLFSADNGDSLFRDKMWIMEDAKADFTSKATDKVQYWTIKERLGYPGAAEIKKQAQEEKAMMMQQQAVMNQIQQRTAMLGGVANANTMQNGK